NRILDIADRIVEMEDGLLTRDAQNVALNHDPKTNNYNT
ncbi:MAG: ABC transporter ATP-binding protein, partial [Dolichospermum circinale Clear-D4]|nr:ABC transporter ATP-binding protein [Dolichospermum circinale Clear-D4]